MITIFYYQGIVKIVSNSVNEVGIMLVIELIYFKSYRIMLQYCLHIIKQIYREFDMHFEKEIRKNNVSKNPRIIHQVVRNLMSVVELKLATEIS